MYLNAKRYLSKYDKKEKALIKKIMPHFKDMKNFELNDVRFQVGYWRKANAIHKWFVDNVQDGADDCGYYDVSSEQLKELLGICEEVIENPEKAEKLLPTQEGFFFGETAMTTANHQEEVVNYYLESLKDTVKIIEKIFKEVNLKEYSIEYSSSW